MFSLDPRERDSELLRLALSSISTITVSRSPTALARRMLSNAFGEVAHSDGLGSPSVPDDSSVTGWVHCA